MNVYKTSLYLYTAVNVNLNIYETLLLVTSSFFRAICCDSFCHIFIQMNILPPSYTLLRVQNLLKYGQLITLTLHWTGSFVTKWTRAIISNTEEKFLLLGGLCHRGYPCDQIHVKNGPDHAFVLEQWCFKVARGGRICPPPVQSRVNIGFSSSSFKLNSD